MSETKNPVFPQDISDGNSSTGFSRHGGMELRDYFAGLAMGLFQVNLDDPVSTDELKDTAADLADWAYFMADAMLVARGAKNGEPNSNG